MGISCWRSVLGPYQHTEPLEGVWPAGEKIQSLLPVTVTGLNTKWEAQLAHACLSIRHGGVHNPKGAQTENEEYNILAVFSEDIFVEVSRCVHMDVSRDGLFSVCSYSADILPCEEGLALG